MKVKLSNADLEAIFEAAHVQYLRGSNAAVSDRCQLLFSMLVATSNYLKKGGTTLEFVMPKQVLCEPVDD